MEILKIILISGVISSILLMFCWKDYWIEEFRAIVCAQKIKKEEELKKLISEDSYLIKQVLELNEETKYYAEILNSGRSLTTVNVDSKAKFDRAKPRDGAYEFLECNRGIIVQALEQVDRNKVIKEVYEKKFSKLSSSAVQADAEKLRIRFERYLELEREIAVSQKLHIVDSYNVICLVRYCSPQGRKKYSKSICLDEEDIRWAYQQLERRTRYQSSEVHRRKSERAKVTPSLRYDVLQRDGFRCCLCGRAAASGAELEVDHIVPISKGGSTTYSNLQTLCRDCNRGKGAKILQFRE